MTIKAPLADDVFQKWLKTKSASDIEKKFGRKASEISAMEVVGKEIHKSPALLFRTTIKKGSTSIKKSKKDYYSYKQLEKETFYKFEKAVTSAEWKGDDDVYLYDKIVESKCADCTGTGLDKSCKKCNGAKTIACQACADEKDLQCKNCKGTGSMNLQIEVINEPGSKKQKVERKSRCSECFGNGKEICQECAGTKKTICNSCKGLGGRSCSTCEGSGTVYRLTYELVPYTGSGDVHVFWNSSIEKELSKAKIMKGLDLLDMLESNKVQAIKITNIKDLEQKKLEDELGFWDKEASTQIKDCKKEFEQLEKGGAEVPKYPIEIYPLQKIDIETYKGKKFSVCSIGSQNGYIVFDYGF